MLRLLYADQGSKQDLLAAVRSIRRWALAQAPAGLSQIRGYLEDEKHPFSGRLHIIGLFTLFYVSFFEQMTSWADQAEAEIITWPGTADPGMTPRTRAALEDLRARMERRAARAEATEPGPRSGPQAAKAGAYAGCGFCQTRVR